ncbi:hypothetical protein LX15_001082 [Streptoalloteichus tenebrarius]|uniref:Uncharacterized protein n=1 Tax=Streptoalloteichus tenebrarius (strain ATCC 17920 / DSM 40477 / JCM 4838 / CBS 697.72 / NBRC 16177 / NCIMB 11028 / NRRL B-12390 / A12253. 1 / ISP 5477) TaxID=1933 RepID=A0ABT1HPG1_STRSD|nr:hypothetical protein [Streptoalloteichus tenebrarius]MCP2257397.1 hypothetical protein [Streptoalloteichus tenebrarius]
MIRAAPQLLRIPPDNSGQLLQLVTLLADPEDIEAFNTAFSQLEDSVREGLTILLSQHENGEWLADERSIGLLRARVDAASPTSRVDTQPGSHEH